MEIYQNKFQKSQIETKVGSNNKRDDMLFKTRTHEVSYPSNKSSLMDILFEI